MCIASIIEEMKTMDKQSINEYSDTIKFVEQSIQRNLTDDEKNAIILDCEICKQLNTGSVEALKRYGIELVE